ncbi:MAG: methylenetetrahydrofolate reductase [Desulfarculus sp.]|nr:methylenetetrahydrofolate reductase [Desulfarculus sp.]
MASFAQVIKDKGFVVTAELDPPRGVDLGALMDLAGRIGPKVDALVVSDNQGANLRQSPWWAAHRLAETTPAEVILTLTCRDRNRLALAGDILAAAASGVDNLLLVSGDFISLGDHPQAKPVYDLDSVQALMLASGLAQGRDLNGQDLIGAPGLCLGAVLAPEARPLAPQAIKMRKKLLAGAGFFITRPLSGPDALKAFLQEAGDPGAPLLAGVEARSSEGVSAAAEMAKAIRASGLARGLHLSASGEPETLAGLVEACAG